MKITEEDIDKLCNQASRDVAEYETSINQEESKMEYQKIERLRIELKQLIKGE